MTSSCGRTHSSTTSPADGSSPLARRGAPRQSVHGYFRVWGSGFDETTGSGTWWNQSYWHHKTFWGPAIHIGRNLPNGSKVCAQLIDTHGAHAAACETIYR